MKKYGLIGKTLEHSFSKKLFTEYFDEHRIDAVYHNIALDRINDVQDVFEEGYAGLNVTIPYKEEIIPFLDELDDVAEAVGAVNTILLKDGKRIGYNTDAFGFHQSIKPFLTNQHERAMILGTGGASKAVAFVLRKIGLDIFYISRTPNEFNQYGYGEINEHMLNACKLMVNCTPVGTYPHVEESLPIPFEHLSKDHLVVDLIYNPEKTKLLQQSEKAGAMIVNGETMLKQQALKAWKIWNDV